MLSIMWSDNGENTTLFSLYSSLENKCLATVKETLVRLVIDSLWKFIALLIEIEPNSLRKFIALLNEIETNFEDLTGTTERVFAIR
jgi:hypothetical protein